MHKGDVIQPLHGLRGIAALTVILGHFVPLLPLGPFGRLEVAPSLGVVLFFILSGFLIGKLYLEREFTRQEVWQYAVARVARVYPLFALVIAGTCLLNWAVPSADIFGLAPDRMAEHLLLAGSAFTVWTISAEFQFYALFVLIWFARDRAPSARHVVIPLLALSVALMAWRGTDASRIEIWGYLHLFVTGLVLANLTSRGTHKWRVASAWALPAFGGLYAIAFLIVPLFYPHRFIFMDPVSIAICAGLLFTCIAAQDCRANRLLSLPVAVWLGEISFSIYLLHRHAQWAVDAALGGMSDWLTLPLKIALTLILAQIANIIVEKPSRAFLRNAGNRIGNRFDIAKNA